jgi:hypothetical protein
VIEIALSELQIDCHYRLIGIRIRAQAGIGFKAFPD